MKEFTGKVAVGTGGALLIVAKTPPGMLFRQGIYRYSRHPLYVSFFIIFIGISISTASWVLLLLAVM